MAPRRRTRAGAIGGGGRTGGNYRGKTGTALPHLECGIQTAGDLFLAHTRLQQGDNSIIPAARGFYGRRDLTHLVRILVQAHGFQQTIGMRKPSRTAASEMRGGFNQTLRDFPGCTAVGILIIKMGDPAQVL